MNKHLPIDRSDKKRHLIKKDGSNFIPICECGYINCDNMHGFMDTPYIRKINKRKRNKECIGCGNKACKCKNTNRGY